MVKEGFAGNGNFENLDAIIRAANPSPMDAVMRNAIPATEQDQPIVDTVADAFAADVNDMVDELRFNPSSNLAEEAQQIMNSPLAAKLGAGVMAGLRAAVQESAEKSANGADAFMRGNAGWEEQKEKREKERAEQAKIDSVDDTALSTTPDRFGNSQQDYADLNNELKTRDGQDRYMAFLRLLHPNMTDEQIRERMEKTAAIAARESKQPLTKRQEEVLEQTSPAEEAEIKGEVDQYNEMNGARAAPKVATQADAQAVATTANTGIVANAAEAQAELLSGGSGKPATGLPRTSVTAQMEGQTEFSTAPSLRDHHRAAMTATTPLDQPAPTVIAKAEPAAPIAQPIAASAGLDV